MLRYLTRVTAPREEPRSNDPDSSTENTDDATDDAIDDATDGMYKKAKMEHGNRDTESNTVNEDKSQDMLESYVNQTRGNVFIWTVECVLWSLVLYALHVSVSLLQSTDSPRSVMVFWTTFSNIIISCIMATINFIITSMNPKAAKFPTEFLACTQAYCGIIGVLGTIVSGMAWKSASSPLWKAAFFPGSSDFIEIVGITLTVGINLQWVISLALTYASTPYGRSNVSFFHIPVAVSLTIIFILINETATNGLGICDSYYGSLFLQLYVNAAIATSFLLQVLSATEFDYLECFPSWMHSQLDRNIEFDVYALIHGILGTTTIVLYALRAELSNTTFTTLVAIAAFTVTVTVVHTFDVKGIVSQIFHTDDEDERRVSNIQKTFAVSFIEAKEIYSAIVRRKNIRIRQEEERKREAARRNPPLVIPVAMMPTTKPTTMPTTTPTKMPTTNRTGIRKRNTRVKKDKEGSSLPSEASLVQQHVTVPHSTIHAPPPFPRGIHRGIPGETPGEITGESFVYTTGIHARQGTGNYKKRGTGNDNDWPQKEGGKKKIVQVYDNVHVTTPGQNNATAHGYPHHSHAHSHHSHAHSHHSHAH